MSFDPTTHACPEFLADFSDFVDGTLSFERRAMVQFHLDCCERCLRHLAAYRRGVEAYREVTPSQVDPDEFWLGIRIRLASDVVEPAVPRRLSWRAPALAAAAVATIALSVLWVGTRIDAGFQRSAERSDLPVVVIAGPPVATALTTRTSEPAPTTADAVRGTSRANARQGQAMAPIGDVATVQPAAYERAAPEPAGIESIDDPALEREFEALRDQIEAAAWLGDPYAEATTRTFQPAAAEGVRIIPLSWTN